MFGKVAGWAKEAGEKSSFLHRLNIGRRLTLCFVFIIAAMALENSVLLWQFHRAQNQVERLRGVDQELILLLQVRTNLMSFYDRVDELAHSEDSAELLAEAAPLRKALLDDSLRTRNALDRLPPEVQLDPTLEPALQAIQDALPAELDAITDLAKLKEWQAIRLRLENQIRPLELSTSKLVENIDHEVSEGRTQALLTIRQAQRRILLIVAITALLTLLFAAFLGLVITRSVTAPLHRLMEGSKALAGGDFSHRVPGSGKDEIALLGNVFNDMVVKLQDLYRELQHREAYLAEAQKLSHTGSFGWHASSGEVFWSEETFRIFECDPAVKPTVGFTLERTHPADRDLVQNTFEWAAREKRGCEFEHRLIMPDGSLKYVRVVAHPSPGDEPGAILYFGAVTDITESKRAQEALRKSESYLAEAQKLTQTGSWAWDVRTGAIFWSQENYRIYGYDPEKITPSWAHILERVHPEDRAEVERRAERESTQIKGGDSEGGYRITLPSGKIKHLHSIAHPVVNEFGEIIEVVGTTMDVTQQYEAKAALETAFEQIKQLKDQLYKENIALREEVDKVSMFEEIVGSSEPLRRVLVQVAKVAATDSTVLILGETGTGKEMIARAIHRRSKRSSRAFIRVNCAAIPPTLIASELFGHEKGAFTGANQRRLGRFELADGGTIFLDEIGELPAETQSALLRVLQEREFERVGGSQSVSVDTRVLSATNRDLHAAVEAGTFRQDLFYRLNVFPIQVPSLRERADDIPVLLEYLIERYAKKAGKKIRNIDKKTMALFQGYSWPGNIRELQNVVERAVILCDGDRFTVDQTWLKRDLHQEISRTCPVLKGLGRLDGAQEKEMIEAALAETGGRVSGPSGAATLLGIPRQTLESKILSLGINKHRFKSV
ncbi:MAG TPA: sigma 54-interacting transcriptional regulator [Candidatus Solibacter sp.]|nr:sigma 54-interacting transcriptional regulator [Candidatus Solibacter sp.]